MKYEGVSWGTSRSRKFIVGAVLALLLTAPVVAPIAVADTTATTVAVERVIVRVEPGADGSAIVRAHGGRPVQLLASLGSLVADVPSSAITTLRHAPGIMEVTPDEGLQLVETSPESAPRAAQVSNGRSNGIHFVADDFGRADGGKSFGALTTSEVATVVGADALHQQGITGQGVDVAIIDTGVAPVPGVGTVVNGADLSFESQVEEARHLDTNGHGTHLAGIITGVAPGSRLVNVKVGAFNGAVDVSQVIAAIDWVVQHRNDNGLDIRVINLAYGTQTTQPYGVDPLAYAAEVAWRHGIVVVTAAGNAGTQYDRLTNPAIDPYVLAVGASEAHGTYSTVDDTVAAFSSRGSAERPVDLVAPGRSVVSARVPGSFVDDAHPEGRFSETQFRGSGTSQAAAVTAGAAALLLDHDPTLTPDEVKAALVKSAKNLPKAGREQGGGILDVDKARKQLRSVDGTTQQWTPSVGTGSLEGARGNSHIEMDGVPLVGEVDIHGNPWDGTSWTGTSWTGTSWTGGDWNGTSWTGTSWTGTSWTGTSWTGTSWTGTSWTGTSWTGTSWTGTSWTGTSWTGTSWTGTSWTGTSWTGTSWTGTSWTGTSWTGTSWTGTSWTGTSWTSFPIWSGTSWT